MCALDGVHYYDTAATVRLSQGFAHRAFRWKLLMAMMCFARNHFSSWNTIYVFLRMVVIVKWRLHSLLYRWTNQIQCNPIQSTYVFVQLMRTAEFKELKTRAVTQIDSRHAGRRTLLKVRSSCTFYTHKVYSKHVSFFGRGHGNKTPRWKCLRNFCTWKSVLKFYYFMKWFSYRTVYSLFSVHVAFRYVDFFN